MFILTNYYLNDLNYIIYFLINMYIEEEEQEEKDIWNFFFKLVMENFYISNWHFDLQLVNIFCFEL
jgi:hypothetical protein